MKENIKYNCKDCGVEVNTRSIGEGMPLLRRQCVQCYSQSIMVKTAPEKPKDAPANNEMRQALELTLGFIEALKENSPHLYQDYRVVMLKNTINNAIAKADGKGVK